MDKCELLEKVAPWTNDSGSDYRMDETCRNSIPDSTELNDNQYNRM